MRAVRPFRADRTIGVERSGGRSAANRKMRFEQAKFEASYGVSSQLPPPVRTEIAFAGRSNVGKSSLLNRVFGRKNLARVSAVPGKTATVNFYRVEDVFFVDLPGYGYAKVSQSEKRRWSELIEGYFRGERDVALVLLLIDIRHTPSALDIDMANTLIDAELPFLVVLTKADKLSKTRREERLAAFRTELPCGEEIHMIAVSSETGDGIEQLRSILEEVCGNE